MKAFFNWSGGKDSALALYKAQGQGINVQALVTTINTATNRVSMHGVRRELAEAQAASIGLPLYTIELPQMPSMQAYEEAVRKMHQHLKEKGFTHGVFGDIFLEDLKTYREALLANDGLRCLFPLWKEDSNALMNKFFALGFEAVVVCTNSTQLDEGFCGRLLNESFLRDLPPHVDVCGENGEYHSFVFNGPVFSKPVAFARGEIVFKEYAAPALRQSPNEGDDCFTTPQAMTGFFFQDLVTV